MMPLSELTTGDSRKARDRLRAAANVLTTLSESLDNPRDDSVQMVLRSIERNQLFNIGAAVEILTKAIGGYCGSDAMAGGHADQDGRAEAG
jgi:hypothetical protein